MLKSYDKVLDNAAWIKQATIYKETTVTTKAKIFYFHGGGLLYGFRKDLPEKHISVITQAGYEIISFDYPLARKCQVFLQHFFKKIFNIVYLLFIIYNDIIRLQLQLFLSSFLKKCIEKRLSSGSHFLYAPLSFILLIFPFH